MKLLLVPKGSIAPEQLEVVKKEFSEAGVKLSVLEYSVGTFQPVLINVGSGAEE